VRVQDFDPGRAADANSLRALGLSVGRQQAGNLQVR
jgi:hypothetical protein